MKIISLAPESSDVDQDPQGRHGAGDRGDDRGKTGRVLSVDAEKMRVIIEK